MRRSGTPRSTGYGPLILAGLFAIAALAGGLAPLFGADVAARPSAQGGRGSSCTDRDASTGALLSTRTLTPTADIMLCETTGVSLTVRASCEAVPIYVMVNIDISGSMIGRPIEDAKSAALAMVDALDMSDSPGTKVGMVVHGDPPRITLRLTDNEGRVRGAINSLRAGGEDNLPKSIDDARAELVRESRGEEPPPVTVMIVLSDGGQTYPPANAIGPARAARAAGIIVVSVCLDNGFGDCGAMRDIASEPRFFFRERDTSGLRRIFTEIAKDVRDINLRSVEVEETLPDGIIYVPDSARPEAKYDPGDRTLTDDRAALRSAIADIATAPHTRIDLALDAAAEELGSIRHDATHRPIVILMTDGLPSNTTPDAVLAAAARARARATVFAIGVGPDVDPALLAEVAGSPERYYPADDADALAAIYREISELVPCERP